MIVEDENALAGSEGQAIEVRRRKTGDAAAHDHQVVFFLDIAVGDWELGILRRANLVELVDSGRVVPAKPGACRRVIRSGCGGGLRWRGAGRTQRCAGNSEGDAIQEVTARDGPVHSKVAIFFG